jgi:hypothetical protein
LENEEPQRPEESVEGRDPALFVNYNEAADAVAWEHSSPFIAPATPDQD